MFLNIEIIKKIAVWSVFVFDRANSMFDKVKIVLNRVTRCKDHLDKQ